MGFEQCDIVLYLDVNIFVYATRSKAKQQVNVTKNMYRGMRE